MNKDEPFVALLMFNYQYHLSKDIHDKLKIFSVY